MLTAARQRRRVDMGGRWSPGAPASATITLFDPERLECRIAGEVKDFDCSHVLDKKDMRRTDRYIQFGLVAAREAMDQAGLPARLEGEEAERTGVIFGTGLGGVGTLVDGISINALRGPDRISPFFIPMGIPNVGAGQIAISFGMTGPNFTTVSACATGGHAIGEAWETIRRGDAETMVAGGAEAGIREPLVGGFDSMHALSRRNDDPEGGLATVRPGPRRVRPRRGRGRRRPRGARACPGPRRDDLRRDRSATARRPTRRTSPCPRRVGSAPSGPPERALRKAGLEPTRHRPRERPRDVDPGRRQGRAPGDPDDLRRRAPGRSRSRPTSR